MDLELVLKEHGLRKTSFRKELLHAFYNSNSSLTADEVKTKVGESADRVTVYRALDAFEKKGLIHRVPDKNNLTRYALCQSKCSTDAHSHNHAHFICNGCDETYCIEDVEIPVVRNTKGFVIKKSKLTLEGNCPSCVDS